MINLYQNICPLEKVEDILTSGNYAMHLEQA
jgi:hypothetical protein